MWQYALFNVLLKQVVTIEAGWYNHSTDWSSCMRARDTRVTGKTYETGNSQITQSGKLSPTAEGGSLDADINPAHTALRLSSQTPKLKCGEQSKSVRNATSGRTGWQRGKTHRGCHRKLLLSANIHAKVPAQRNSGADKNRVISHAKYCLVAWTSNIWSAW